MKLYILNPKKNICLAHLLLMVLFNSSTFIPIGKTQDFSCFMLMIFIFMFLDLRHLEEEKEKENIASPRGTLEVCMNDFDFDSPPLAKREASCSSTRAHNNWSNFFKLLKKKSFKRLGSLTHFISPKIPKWKSRSSRESHVLSKLYNFNSSWVTFNPSDLRKATHNFDSGMKPHPN